MARRLSLIVALACMLSAASAEVTAVRRRHLRAEDAAPAPSYGGPTGKRIFGQARWVGPASTCTGTTATSSFVTSARGQMDGPPDAITGKATLLASASCKDSFTGLPIPFDMTTIYSPIFGPKVNTVISSVTPLLPPVAPGVVNNFRVAYKTFTLTNDKPNPDPFAQIRTGLKKFNATSGVKGQRQYSQGVSMVNLETQVGAFIVTGLAALKAGGACTTCTTDAALVAALYAGVPAGTKQKVDGAFVTAAITAAAAACACPAPATAAAASYADFLATKLIVPELATITDPVVPVTLAAKCGAITLTTVPGAIAGGTMATLIAGYDVALAATSVNDVNIKVECGVLAARKRNRKP